MSIIIETINNVHTCAICLDELTIPSSNICITQCAHIFHLNCFLQNREFNTTCPMCRSDILVGEETVAPQHNIVNVLPDGMLDENHNIEQNTLFDRFAAFEEISNGIQLRRHIEDIVHYAANNNISNFEINPDEIRNPVHAQIYNICIYFANSTLNYFRNIVNPIYNINHLSINNINIEFYTHIFNLQERVIELVNNAANNNIRNNITFNRMEHEISDLCIEFTESIIFDIQHV